MTISKLLVVAVALATMAGGASALAQTSALTNGPNGTRPNRLSSDGASSINGNAPSRAIMNPHSGFYASGANLLPHHGRGVPMRRNRRRRP